MTDTQALFHNPERLSDKELAAMRWKLRKQKLTTPLAFCLGAAGGHLIDSYMFNSRYFGRRLWLLTLPGFAFAAAGGYYAYYLDQAVDMSAQEQLLHYADERLVRRSLSVAQYGSNWTPGSMPHINEKQAKVWF